jgi:ribosomal protein S2
MVRLPGVVVVVDPKKKRSPSTSRAFSVFSGGDGRYGLRPTTSVFDSKCDDSIRAIRLIVGKLADAVLEGMMRRESGPEEGDRVSSLEGAARRNEADG